MPNLLLAGDIGGTKTLLGVFEADRARPRSIETRSFGTLDFADLSEMVAAFMKEPRLTGRAIHAACFGVAGPVIDESAVLTNVPWRVDARQVTRDFAFRHVALLNDLEAMAYAVCVLDDDEVHVLQQGEPLPAGNLALIAAGTGLGEALLHHVDGRFIPSPTEAGHADFAARTEREIALLRELTARFGRVEVERVISGRGLLNVHAVVHRGACSAGVNTDNPVAAAAISSAALERRCPDCVETLDLFVEAYGAETGNLALRSVATGGVFVGGGIAPKILPALTTGSFMHAFRAKSPLDPMLARMPVKVILNAQAGLLGAAVYASGAHETG